MNSDDKFLFRLEFYDLWELAGREVDFAVDDDVGEGGDGGFDGVDFDGDEVRSGKFGAGDKVGFVDDLRGVGRGGRDVGL